MNDLTGTPHVRVAEEKAVRLQRRTATNTGGGSAGLAATRPFVTEGLVRSGRRMTDRGGSHGQE